MRLFGRARAAEPAGGGADRARREGRRLFRSLDRYQAAGMERKLYDTLRLTVPIIDAAVCKIVRLTGGVSVQCESRRAREDLNRFLESVQVNGLRHGNRDVSGNLFRTASHLWDGSGGNRGFPGWEGNFGPV